MDRTTVLRLPPIPPLARLLICGSLIAGIAYLAWGLEQPAPAQPGVEAVEATVAVPPLDRTLLTTVRDATREQRLQLEKEPLRHLLQAGIDVGPTVALALGMPEQPVPPATVRADLETWRGRWIWYEGELKDLSGPREGHPIQGYGIHEATIALADGGFAIGAFSIPPDAVIRPGSWVRIEGYLLKLRDTTYPLDVREAPMLVGREIRRDYEDWPAVHELDPAVMAKVDDTRYWPGDPTWHTVEEDQTEPLWHLAAFARDTADSRSFEQWRERPILSAHDFWEPFRDNEVQRGEMRRIIGTLIRRQSLAAPPNPAGIRFWTVAWVQVREYAGATVPIWVPQRVRELPLRAQLEVRGFYYRRFAYESMNGQRHFVPLFVAADLDSYVLETGPAMRQIGLVLVVVLTVLILLFWLGQRRSARETLAHQQHLDARRRRRREQNANRSAPAASAP
ncbi:MAG: hypothetical protein JNL08_05205 [Planctomycetes bacterium]|nr:hypothetical protein [Planctomycetota bacterium]